MKNWMKGTVLAVLAFSTPVLAKDAPLADAALSAGNYQLAVVQLERAGAGQSNDPAQLINLGQAYLNLGETRHAETLFRAALISFNRYDIVLANGTVVDSRELAQRALNQLSSRYVSR
ncbi:MAG: hypothetical protein U5J78_05930 [Parasphingorhabdus sp.]|nr:hypothetical protein [Parasphingorhabdus sp.]